MLVGGPRLLRAGLRRIVDDPPHVEAVGDADDLRSALAAAARSNVDVVVLDGDDALDACIDVLRALKTGVELPRVLVLATRRDDAALRRAVLAGASGIVFKDQPPEHLSEAIRKVHDGELWVERAAAGQLIDDAARSRRERAADPELRKINRLTKRERELVGLLATGLGSPAIAARMGISAATVRHHLTSVLAKLELGDRLALVVYAFRHGIVKQHA